MIERTKFTRDPLVFDHRVVYEQVDQMKPRGFWYSAGSADDGWDDWCLGEEWNVDGLRYRSAVDVDLDRMLVLTDEASIRFFADEYSRPMSVRLPDFRSVDWPSVARCYAGIEVAPYCWSLRLEPGFLWYYGWDCASGCVWDLSAIRSVARCAPNEDERVLSRL